MVLYNSESSVGSGSSGFKKRPFLALFYFLYMWDNPFDSTIFYTSNIETVTVASFIDRLQPESHMTT